MNDRLVEGDIVVHFLKLQFLLGRLSLFLIMDLGTTEERSETALPANESDGD